jgi:hypothetical protein
MLVSFWAFELASVAAFARAPRRNGKARLMRLDVLALSNLLAVAEADLEWGLMRRACVLAGLERESVTHVKRSTPRTGAALIIRARIYCSRFFDFEVVALRMAARMMKLARRTAGVPFSIEQIPGTPHTPHACRASSRIAVRIAIAVQPRDGRVQPRAPP